MNVKPLRQKAEAEGNGLQKAMADVKAGRVYHAESAEDLIRQCLE